jgi:predicted nucleic acid-binding protein
MTTSFVDTDVLIRLLTGDDLSKQAEARQLFQLVEKGSVTLLAPDTVIADAVYILSSRRLYALTRDRVSAILTSLVMLPGFEVDNKPVVLAALAIYANANIDFGDAMLAAVAQWNSPSIIYSYDRDFDRLPAVTRRAPGVAFSG